MANNELKLAPCPFCGSAAHIKRGKTTMVSCTVCTASTFQSLGYTNSAISSWNRRAAPAQGGLSDAEIKAIPNQIGMLISHDGKYMRSVGGHGMTVADGVAFARAIESRIRGQQGGVSDAADAARYRFVRQHPAMSGPMIKHLMIGNLPLDESITAAIQAQAGDVKGGA